MARLTSTPPTQLLITGSRKAPPAMRAYARRAVARAAELGWHVIVGDAAGVDAAVIAACDTLRVPITVCGAHGRLRRRTRTGENLALGSRRYPYVLRDLWMAARCDVCLALWDGTSRGTRKTFAAAREMGKRVHLKTFPPSL